MRGRSGVFKEILLFSWSTLAVPTDIHLWDHLSPQPGSRRFNDGFFPSSSLLWNSLPSPVFPASFNLPSFKRQVYHYLRVQMAWFFLSSIYQCILHFFKCFSNLFYSYHCLPFLFLKGCRLEKKKQKKHEMREYLDVNSSSPPLPSVLTDCNSRNVVLRKTPSSLCSCVFTTVSATSPVIIGK